MRLQAVCGMCWGTSGHGWLGHVLGLNRLSLRYPTPGEEAGYLKGCSDRLCKGWASALVVAVAVYSYWLIALMDTPTDPDDPAYPVLMVTFYTRVTFVLVALVHLGVMSVPRLRRAVSVATWEKAAVVLVLFCELTFFDRYYGAKLCGFTEPIELFPDLEGYTDTFVVLNLCIGLMVTHICFPIRWFLLVAIEVTALAVYGVIVFVLGSPEPWGTATFTHFVVFVILIAFGKRQSEVNDRLVFSAFLAEKAQRTQAEFQLSRATAERPDQSDDEEAASGAPTTATGEVFTGLEKGPAAAEDRPGLETIWDIGKKEHWLIDEQELAADPHECLGKGGFGVVVAGEFHGSPVALKLHTRTGSARPLFEIGNELRLMRKLRHPNIVLLHGACISVKHNDLVLVLERVIGESMVDFVAHQPPAVERWKSMLDVCHALRYLHSRQPPIAHGDLKPQNVIVEHRSTGVVAKLLDFGLARLFTRSAKPGGGTHRWMAPGVLRAGSALRLGDDVFPYGLVLYFVATGLEPFATSSDKTMAAYARGSDGASATLDWPCEISEFASRCKPIISLCTDLAEEERPAMEQVHEAVQGLGAGLGESAATAGLGPRCSASGEPDLWSDLLLARQVAQHSSNAKRKTKLLKASRRRRQRTVSAATKHPPSVPEEDAVQEALPNAPAVTHRYPSFRPTPSQSMFTALVQLMLAWNDPIAPDCCCEFHASVRQLASMCSRLSSREECARFVMEDMKVYQCPSCQVLIADDDDAVLTELFCHWCGYAGLPGLHAST